MPSAAAAFCNSMAIKKIETLFLKVIDICGSLGGTSFVTEKLVPCLRFLQFGPKNFGMEGEACQ